MSSIVNITGALVAGPQSTSDCGFPGGVLNVALALRIPSKPAAVQVTQVRQLASPSAYVALDGVGAGEAVTQGNFLYLKTNAPIVIRMTTKVAVGPNLVAEIPVYGLLILEVPDANYILLLEAQGAGTLEYFISGNQ